MQQLSTSNFISGVIEGFYGRPWMIDQRRRLFSRLRDFGMNTYLYAPKDDSKHRAYWRELYSVEEGEALRVLIESAHENNINFVYAISPGLDVTYSSERDQQILKRKLDQVKEFGCKYFAILFDDIDSEMQQADKIKFGSYGEAQSYLTNELYLHLNEPEIFFFCPTEYCDVFAKPNTDESSYLKTIGERLLPKISVFWTGPGIISEYITIRHIKKIQTLLRRKPLIWDNFHANDYDLNCIYLGPFTSRSPNLRKYLSGLLTNPNCEFECNHVPIHTLALWTHAECDDTDDDEFDLAVTTKLSKTAYNESNLDIDTPSKVDYDDEDVVRVDESLLDYIDQYLNNRPNVEPIDLNRFFYEPERILQAAVKKWLPVLNEKEVQITVYKLPMAQTAAAEELPEPQAVINDDCEITTTTTSVTEDISALNSNTKQKAQLDACNSLVVTHHLYHHHQTDPISEIEAVTSTVANESPIQATRSLEQQGELLNGNDGIVLVEQEAPIASLLTSAANNHKKKLKKFSLSNTKFDNLKQRRKRERVDGGEFFKLRSIKKKSKKTRKTPLPSTIVLVEDNNNGDDYDDDDRMDEQKVLLEEEMDSMRPSSSIFRSPVAQTMLVDDLTNIECASAAVSVLQEPPSFLDSNASSVLPVTTSANDIELLSIPPMSLPPSTRASSIASFKSSSSSSLLSSTNKKKRKNGSNSPKKRKKYEPLISLSSSSRACFKVARKKLKKCVNNLNSKNTVHKKISYNNLCTSPMDLGMLSDTTTMANPAASSSSTQHNSQMNECDLRIVIDFYYLPFEYGKFAIYLLKEFKWLKMNAIRLNLCGYQNRVNEWMKRCERYLNVIDRVDLIQTKLTKISNKQLFIEVDTRFNELNNFLQIIRLFVCWLQQNCFVLNENRQEFCLNLNQYYRSENCDRLEPWDFRGGIVDELKRVAYFKSFNDLFSVGFPIQTRINTEMFKLRNYRSSDYDQIKQLFLHNSTELSYDLSAVDLFLEYSSEYCFIIENKNTQQICGILLAALSVRRLNEIYKMSYLSKLCEKYPIGNGDNQALIMNFHNNVSPFKLISNETLLDDYSSIFTLKLNPSVISNELDMTYLVRQLLAALFLCLKSQGSTGLHTQFSYTNKDEDAYIEQLIVKFNFKKVISSDDEIKVDQQISSSNYKILGRRMRFKQQQQHKEHVEFSNSPTN